MITVWLVGVLTVLLGTPVARRLRSAPRDAACGHDGRPRRGSRRAPDYASMLDAVARQVRSGSSLTSAILDEIDTSSALVVVVDRLAGGESLPDALGAAVPDDADVAFTIQALSATAQLGGPIAATLDQAAAVLRERSAARAERRAYGAQARLSARVLTIVPLGFAVWSAVVSQRTRDVYVSTAAGSICALCGIALNLAGWRWMRRIIGPA